MGEEINESYKLGMSTIVTENWPFYQTYGQGCNLSYPNKYAFIKKKISIGFPI